MNPMDRRRFLRCAPAAIVLPALLERGGYRPIGHLAAGDVAARAVDFVTLDGRMVESVIELNDVEGWLVHYGPPGHLPQVPHRRTGQVRVYWRTPPRGAEGEG